MTTTIESPNEKCWKELESFLGPDRYGRCEYKRINKLANTLSMTDVGSKPTRGLDGMSRPYFSVQVLHDPEYGFPSVLGVVMFYYQKQWNGHIVEQQQQFDDLYGYEEKHKLPDKGRTFIEKLFGGKYSDYHLNIEGDG